MLNLKSGVMMIIAASAMGGCVLETADPGNAIIPVEGGKDSVLIESIAAMGFAKDQIRDYGDFFLVEGDIGIEKADLLPKAAAKTTQRRYSYLVDQMRVRNITVRVDASVPKDGPGDWWDATQTAIAQWNAIVPSSIQFVYTTATTANISIVDAGHVFDNSGTIAESEWPTSGSNPGNRIRINLTDFRSWTYKSVTMTHELGHCIGFTHTNSSDGSHIEQTPDDPYSIMVKGSYGTKYMTPMDQLSAAALYPVFDPLGGAWWDQAVDMTALGGYLYILHSARLYQVDPVTGNFAQKGGSWWDRGVAIASANSMLYIIHAGNLYQVDPSTGNFVQKGPSGIWNSVADMTASGSYLYIINSSQLYQVDPNTGAAVAKGSAVWTSAKSLTSQGGSLYAIQANALWEIDPATGANTRKGDAVYAVNPIRMASLAGRLYVVENSCLNRVDASGFYIHGPDAIWSSTKGMTSMGDYLYIIQGATLFRVLKQEI